MPKASGVTLDFGKTLPFLQSLRIGLKSPVKPVFHSLPHTPGTVELIVLAERVARLISEK